MPKQKSKLKIGFVLDGGLDKPDGVQQYILALGDWFIKRGHEVKYLVAGQVSLGDGHGVSLGRSIKVRSNGNNLTIPLPTHKKRLRSYLETEQFDVLHIQTPYSPLMGERLIFLASKRSAIVGTFHIVPISPILHVGDWLLGHYSYRSIKRFDKMFSVSTAAQKIVKRDFLIESEVLPNVVDYQRFNTAKAKAEFKDGRINILFFGRLVERKGCIILLKAVHLLLQQGVDKNRIRLIIAGSGPEADNLKSYAEAAELTEICSFLGFVSEEDKPSIYASADISVFPSIGGESFGIVLLEAMASGNAAVLGGNNVGYSSVLGPQPELLFDTTMPAVLAGKLHRLIEKPELRHDYAAWGQEYTKSFDTGVVGARLEEVYNQIVCEKQT